MTNLPKIWPSSGSENEQRVGIIRMLNELGIDTSDAPEGGSLNEYAAEKEQQHWDAQQVLGVYETGQRLAQLETAQEILTALGSTRSGWIYQEEQKSNPDEVKMQQWSQERADLADLRDSLTMRDTAKLQATINTYGPQLKELMANSD